MVRRDVRASGSLVDYANAGLDFRKISKRFAGSAFGAMTGRGAPEWSEREARLVGPSCSRGWNRSAF